MCKGELSSSSATGTKGCLNLSSRCCVVGANRSRSWRKCSGSIARRARDSVDLFRRSSMGKFFYWFYQKSRKFRN